MTTARPADWRHHLDVHDMIAELVRPHHHREHYTRDAPNPNGYRFSSDHVTRVPSLLTQLQHAAPSSDGHSRTGAYESRPAARLEAVDVYIAIDNESARWVRRLGLDDPGNTARCLMIVASQLRGTRARRCDRVRPAAGCCPSHEIEHAIRTWWTHARIVTGWDEPAWRPDNTCPSCEKRGGLRIRLEDRVGMCVECRAAWDPSGYQQLAAHIREETDSRLARQADPCWCPWPTPVERIDQLCRQCGSGRCHRAIAANLIWTERRQAEREMRWTERRRRLASDARRTTHTG